MAAEGNQTDVLERLAALESAVARIDKNVQKLLDNQFIKQILQPATAALYGRSEAQKKEWEQWDISDTNGPFGYAPLDASRKEIRLLTLRAQAELDAPVECKLRNISIEDDGAFPNSIRGPDGADVYYSALSYTWGDVKDMVSITVNGRELEVTRNLEAALRHMRKHQSDQGVLGHASAQHWWVDAICIDQTSVQERNNQVSLMTKIFSKASTVHVWLGEEDDDSASTMKLLEQLSTHVHIGPGETPKKFPRATPEEKRRYWKALISFFERPWWERVWVRQEIALGATATVHLGRLTRPWDDVVTAASMLNYLTDHLLFDPSALEGTESEKIRFTTAGGISCFRRAVGLDDLRQAVGVSSYTEFVDLTDLIFHTRGCEATDLRDKAYATLGMADTEIYSLAPDYRSPINEVYRDVALTLAPHTLDFLSCCQNPGRLNGLPSWVPNLADSWKAPPFPLSKFIEKPKAHFDEASNVLIVTGVLMDVLEIISEQTVIPGATREELHALKTGWNNFAKQFDFSEKREHAYGWDESRWETLIMLGERPWVERPVKYRPNSPQGRGRTVDDDPQIRVVKGLLLPDGYVIKDRGKIDQEYLSYYGVGRRIALTQTGFIGLIPADARPEDVLCILPGATYPYVLRRHGGQYLVVGEACEFSIPRSARQTSPCILCAAADW